ncbi:GNAT family N-acetyltransferase [Marinitenerispora sediminis]|uniref:Lysine N-acyltransferase MbtK n=1 Tax=Marinitenerispora sediminis TaxID=1931232 RepID=A0A368TA70_9ACTN|nr:GNAT family N-acetyltransferase [Marinitenerispora sediminis]RCV52964.1 GNAT family N-acetyltransferase [Marinitenerispora sediminis]RCV58443.1 GNAT family N-acetyltransferase [Marinitenerispora sediminis]RCV61777.1 GNAT family N-acetyltransferase [Marinitenerispora sediminis]
MPDRAPATPATGRGSLTFRPLVRADFPLLLTWLRAPHVRAWWRGGPTTLDGVEREYGPQVDGTDPTRCFVLHLDGTPIGLFQCYRHADNPDWDRAVGVPAAAGLDYLIGEPDRCGAGIGSAAITAFTATMFGLYPEVDAIVSVPQRDNRPSCRVLEKAGFTLLEERLVDSDDPSDSGVSAIYALRRTAPPAG